MLLLLLQHVRVRVPCMLQHTCEQPGSLQTLLLWLLCQLMIAVRCAEPHSLKSHVPHCATSQSTLLLLITHLLCKSCTRRVQVRKRVGRVIHTGGCVMHVVRQASSGGYQQGCLSDRHTAEAHPDKNTQGTRVCGALLAARKQHAPRGCVPCKSAAHGAAQCMHVAQNMHTYMRGDAAARQPVTKRRHLPACLPACLTDCV